MQRYFIESSQIHQNRITIEGGDVHHIRNVMRMKVGDQILCVNRVHLYLCAIQNMGDVVDAEILETRIENNELPVEVTIAHGLVRREKTEEVIRRLTELGCMAYIPVSMKRSVVKFKEDKSDRHRKIVKEAMEQSHRNQTMEILDHVTLPNLVKMKSQFDLVFFAHVDEESKSIKDHLVNFKGKKILVLVGPEGGFGPTEVALLKKNGFLQVGLGSRVLRTETAPLYVMSVIGYEFGE